MLGEVQSPEIGDLCNFKKISKVSKIWYNVSIMLNKKYYYCGVLLVGGVLSLESIYLACKECQHTDSKHLPEQRFENENYPVVSGITSGTSVTFYNNERP